MNDQTRNFVYGVLIGLPTLLIVWIFWLYFYGCQNTAYCTGIKLPDMTPIPTLRAATLPAPKVGAEAVAATPKCSVAALNLIDAWIAAKYPEKDTFPFTDAKGAACTGTFNDDVHKLFITPNLWYDGAPACTTCHYADVAKAVKNMDLSSYAGMVAGSNRVNGAPKGNDILGGGNPANALLHQMLYAPGGKTLIGRPAMPFGRPATVPAEGPVISAGIPSGAAAAPATTATPGAGATATPAATSASTAATTPTAASTASTPAATTAAGGTAVPEVARPSNPGGPGDAINLKGDATSGKAIFITNCVVCHSEEGHGGVPNPGSDDGTVPALNPIDPTLANKDPKIFATNIDLFIQHGSTPAGTKPEKSMPAWGDTNALSQQQIADVIAYVIQINTPANGGAADVARPSNPGGPGDAVNQSGDAAAGGTVFNSNCIACHGQQGVGGIPNPGSTDGVVPSLNPIDPTIANKDPKIFATNVDLFIQHGSTPDGPNPTLKMPAWGDTNTLTQKQIADVIAFIIKINTTQPGSVSDAARPSNPGGAGVAITLTGNAQSGEQIFTQNCVACHAPKGVGGIQNPGSSDGTVPALNPIDPTIKNANLTTFAYNLDLFIEHGSTPAGKNPQFRMPAWGDSGSLTPQQIADVIAYLISLNK